MVTKNAPISSGNFVSAYLGRYKKLRITLEVSLCSTQGERETQICAFISSSRERREEGKRERERERERENENYEYLDIINGPEYLDTIRAGGK